MPPRVLDGPSSLGEWIVGTTIRSALGPKHRRSGSRSRGIVRVEVSTDDESGEDSLRITYPRTARRSRRKKQNTAVTTTVKKVRFKDVPPKSVLKKTVSQEATPESSDSETETPGSSDTGSCEASTPDGVASEEEATDSGTSEEGTTESGTSGGETTERSGASSDSDRSAGQNTNKKSKKKTKRDKTSDTSADTSSSDGDSDPHETCRCSKCVRGRRKLKHKQRKEKANPNPGEESTEEPSGSEAGGSSKARAKGKNQSNKRKAKVAPPGSESEDDTSATTSEAESEPESPNKVEAKGKGKSKNGKKKNGPPGQTAAKKGTKDEKAKNEKVKPAEKRKAGNKKTGPPKKAGPPDDEKKGTYPEAFPHPHPRRPCLIEPIRAEVVQTERVMETPQDPPPNAYYDAEHNIIRVYHGPVWGGNPNQSLYPRRDSSNRPLPAGMPHPTQNQYYYGFSGQPPQPYGNPDGGPSAPMDWSRMEHQATGQPPATSVNDKPPEDSSTRTNGGAFCMSGANGPGPLSSGDKDSGGKNDGAPDDDKVSARACCNPVETRHHLTETSEARTTHITREGREAHQSLGAGGGNAASARGSPGPQSKAAGSTTQENSGSAGGNDKVNEAQWDNASQGWAQSTDDKAGGGGNVSDAQWDDAPADGSGAAEAGSGSANDNAWPTDGMPGNMPGGWADASAAANTFGKVDEGNDGIW